MKVDRRLHSVYGSFVRGLQHAWMLVVMIVLATGCRHPSPPGQSNTTPEIPDASSAAPFQVDSTPTDPAGTIDHDELTTQLNPEMLESISLFNRGAALMENFEYKKAAEIFQKVVDAQPDWTAARFNLGLALLNRTGKSEGKKSLSSCIDTFHTVLKSDPNHLSSLFCLGMAYDYLGDLDKALDYFQRVHQVDPNEPFVAYKYAEALQHAGKKEEAIKILETFVLSDPGFVSGTYSLARLYMATKQRKKAIPLFNRFKQLNKAELATGSYVVAQSYGMAGKYYVVLGADSLPIWNVSRPAQPKIVLSPDLRTLDCKPVAWTAKDSQIGMPGIAVADIDGDNDLDILLTALDAQGAAAFWINDGKGHFTRGKDIGGSVVAPCVGDIDNDGDTDLYLGRAGTDHVLLNDGKGQFSDSAYQGISGPDALTAVSRVMDIDSDGDLDLLAYHCTKGSVPATAATIPLPGSLLLNHTNGTFADSAPALGLALPASAIASVVYDDFDNDHDLDLVLFPCTDEPLAWVNFRLGQFAVRKPDATGLSVSDVLSATSGDPDKDGDRDLLVFTAAGLQLMLNQGAVQFKANVSFGDGVGKIGGTGGQFADMDNDGDLDIVVADAKHADGHRGPAILVNLWPEDRFVPLSDLDRGNLLDAIDVGGNASCAVADLTGNGRCDILLAATGRTPMLIENVTPGGHWITLDLAGRRTKDIHARSANSAIGARVGIQTGRVYQQYVVGGSAGPVSASPLRIHAGLGRNPNVEWLRIIWPDAALQGELEVAGDRIVPIDELNRRISSCPFLFVWDGHQFAFVADFGGVGGLGYLVTPGLYARPDSTEYLRIPKLQPIDGQYVLHALTPLEEITYFDEAKLIAVDHPKGTQVHPNEMMAIQAPLPEFKMYCVHHAINPVKAVDHLNQNVTDRILKADRRYAGTTDPDLRFIGYAKPHSVQLDFGDQLSKLGDKTQLILFLEGWVEYGYSSTNFAAGQAQLSLKAPSIDVWRDGRWIEVFHEVGYPAGLNHTMTLDLTGKILPSDRKIRISSNMELYWDRIYIGECDVTPPIHIKEVTPVHADLHFRGYPREYSPDGRHPNLYDYANMDRSVAWKLMTGRYTRFGDVLPLLETTDDCFVIMGHGEELTLRFNVADFGPVPEGYERTFVLKADSYCKDMDLYTAMPDTVSPLPFHGMSGYPYGPGEHYPETTKTRAYRRTYNTRVIRNR